LSENSYQCIDRIEDEVGKPSGPVLICLGPTATVLAWRLARKGVHAIDLGHVGMFMRRFDPQSQITINDLCTSTYKDLLVKKHGMAGWGASGYSHADEVTKFANELGALTILDYGCGRGTLKDKLPQFSVFEYDPGIPGKDMPPQDPVDLVVSTDVLEHIEKNCLDAVLAHMRRLARRGIFLTIATKLARDILPDGRNAHLLVHPKEWWLSQLKRYALLPYRIEQRKSLTLWIRR
jgi:hypothetical protein